MAHLHNNLVAILLAPFSKGAKLSSRAPNIVLQHSKAKDTFDLEVGLHFHTCTHQIWLSL